MNKQQQNESAPPPPRPVSLVDTTLREGQQHGLVAFSVEQALDLAKLLDAFHIDILEVGHPAASQQATQTGKAICSAGLSCATLGHARAACQDVARVVEIGADWAGIFASVNDTSVRHKMHRARDAIYQAIREAIAEAKRNGLHVQFTCEDGSRTPLDLVSESFEIALEEGVDRVYYADTVGIMRPREMYDVVKTLTQRFGPVVHVHCHNDFGLGTANVLAAYEAGAVGLDVTIDGIGERCGLVPLAEVACALTTLYGVDAPWDLSLLQALSTRLNQLFSRGSIDARPIVGRYAFAHKSSLHIAAEIEERTTYELFPPERVGQTRRFILSKLIGRASLASLARLAGMECDKDSLNSMVELLKTCVQPTELEFPAGAKKEETPAPVSLATSPQKA